MASSSAKTPLKRNIAGLFNHLRYTPPSGSKNDGGTSAGGRLRAEIDQQDDHDPATTQASAPTAGLDVPRLVKTERRSLFFPASAEVKQEDGEGDEGEIGSVDPSKSGYFSSATGPSRKRKAETPPPRSEDEEGLLLQVTPKKVFAPVRPFAAPEKYEHLNFVGDNLAPDLDILFCGINPGVSSAKKGHHYAGPTNRFWPCLHQSGIVPDVVTYKDDARLPQDYNVGLTNLVDRPTMSASELSSALDMRPSVPSLLAKILAYRPTIVCFVGKDIWREFHFVVKAGSAGKEVKTKGKEKEKIEWNEPKRWKVVHPSDGGVERETYFFVVSSTSGLCRDKMKQRLESWGKLNQFKTELLRARQADAPESAVEGHDVASYDVVDVERVSRWVDGWNEKQASKAALGKK